MMPGRAPAYVTARAVDFFPAALYDGGGYSSRRETEAGSDMTKRFSLAALGTILGLASLACGGSALAAAAAGEATGVAVSYQLPTDGPLPRTYRVTLAIVDPKNPDWIISQFACGAARTVTAENGGKFAETWDGLDDNFMPVPPGEYAVKGIYMSARQWAVDGEWHSIVPRFVTGASAWMPSPEDAMTREPFGGDPCNAPLGDVAIGASGVAVWHYVYLENGLGCPMIDLKKPAGFGQFLRSFPTGGAAGGTSVATDGETVWGFSTDGGPKFVYRADGKPFGASPTANRRNSYPPEGWVTSMAAWRDAAGGKSFVAVAQRGKIIQEGKRGWAESDKEFVDKITIHEGEGGKVLATLSAPRPQSVTAQGGVLYVLHAEGPGFAVSEVRLAAGLPQGALQRRFTVPADIKPLDLKVDSRGRFYLSDPAANHVYQLSGEGKRLLAFGKLDAQKPGTYDPQTLMAPAKMATWTDAEGADRLIIVENAGPNRASEWSADGKLLREFLSLQTKTNDGYAVDPENPAHFYVPGQQGWLARFKVDFEKRSWTVDAVWPLADDPRARGLKKPRLIRAGGRMYLAGGGGSRENAFNVYRIDADRCALSASILRVPGDAKKPFTYFLWHDANGNGRVDDEEMAPTEPPAGIFNYHGQNWGEDLAFLAIDQGSRDVYRLAPSGFDAHGNPILKEWKKIFSDPVFAARAEGKADAIHGGNELADKFSSDWMQADGTPAEGFYVQARGGKNFSANEGAQHKVSRYAPDGAGGYRLVWRTGRTALQGLARPGEMYGAMRIRKPLGGLVSVIDQSRCGILLYTADGLYVDTLFTDGRKLGPKAAGLYALPGEFFAGDLMGNRENGRIYILVGKYTPLVYDAEGWSMTENPARPLRSVQPTVKILASQMASPPEIALALRGGAGTAKLARFAPALGGAAMDGSLDGWESCEPVQFAADKDQAVEVRCLYDAEHLYLRWHARMAVKFQPKPREPVERIFSHGRLADTLSFYMQGDAAAPAGGPAEGRPGDVRFVFGVFQDGDAARPVAVGMYPQWTGKGSASPQSYRSPVGAASFAHVGPVDGAQLFHKIDADGKGFVLVAAIPRAAIPRIGPLAGGTRTMVNFEATFAGHNKFWWANSDGSAGRETYDEPSEARLYPGSWAPAEFQGLAGGVVVRDWLLCGPWGGPGAEKFGADNRDESKKNATRALCDAARYPPDDGKVDLAAVFTGDLLRGYWPDPRQVRWKPARIADLDTRVTCGPSAQVWYGATWINAPAETPVEFAFQGHQQTYLRWSLNGQTVLDGEIKSDGPARRCVATKTLTLRAGWNQVMFRGYCVGYPPFRAGVVLHAPDETLWKLKLSAVPPK